MQKKLKLNTNFSYILLIFLISAALFLSIRDKALFTPDFGESDAYHFNFAMKYYLSENLKNNTLPFWTDKLGTGYPLISEGQIGAFYIPNIIFLKFLPYNVAYSLLFIAAFFLLTCGFYLLLREFKVRPLLAFLCAISFSFNGSLIFRLVHLNLIQAFSMSPYLFLFFIRFLKTFEKKYVFLYCFFLSQTIFAGYVPVVYVTLLGLFAWTFFFALLKSGKQKAQIIKVMGLLALMTGFGLLLAAPQILPSSLLTDYSVRKLEIPYKVVTQFPLQLRNLANFFSPYIFGNPKYATYPPFSSDWGIFWENTPYIGFIFFLLFAASLLFFIKGRKKYILFASLSTLIVCLLLAFGKNSPFYFLFYYPPFNFFRTQSRFLMIGVFFIFFFTALSLENFINKKKRAVTLFVYILLVANFVDLFLVAKNYHLFMDFARARQEPPIVKFIDKENLFFSFEQPNVWNKYFLKKGWSNNASIDAYMFFRSYLYPNSNLLFSRRGLSINSFGLAFRRVNYLESLLTENLRLHLKNNDTKLLTGLLDILAIKYVITSDRPGSPLFREVQSFKRGGEKIYLSQYVKNADDIYYIPQRVKKIRYVEEFEEMLRSGDHPSANAVVEENVTLPARQQPNRSIRIEEKTTNTLTLRGHFERDTFLAVKKNYYPEWEAKINNKKTPIYKTNLIHMGLIVPRGDATITFHYANKAFKKGVIISLLSLSSLLLLLYSSSELLKRFKPGFNDFFKE